MWVPAIDPEETGNFFYYILISVTLIACILIYWTMWYHKPDNQEKLEQTEEEMRQLDRKMIKKYNRRKR